MNQDRYARLAHWYKWVTWLGIVLNLLFVIPLLFFPTPFLALLGLRCDPPIWAQAPGLLLLWISIFYIPASLDLKKYRVYAWIAVFPTRFGGATFFFLAVALFDQPAGFLSIAVVDFVIMLWQLAILLKVRDAENPKSAEVLAYRAARCHRFLAWAGVVIVVIGITGWYKLLREVDQRFDSMEEQFKYGSIGGEQAQGIPFWIWFVLPRMFPEYLPRAGGYSALGAISEPGRSTPIGFSVKTVGIDRVAINCALCHTATVRLSAADTPMLLIGAGTIAFDGLSYERFLFRSASDPRFTATNILAEIDKSYRLSVLDRLLYRCLLIPATKAALLKQKEAFAWTDTRPDWGPGRIDPFNPVKQSTLKVPVGDTLGNSDMVPIWHLRARQNWSFHWDGLNTSLTEVVRSSALGDGATPKSIPLADLQKLQDWLMDLKAPPYPSALPVNSTLAAAGKPVFEHNCATCHAPSGPRAGQVVPVEEVGTDPNRVRMWTPESAAAYNAYASGYAWGFSHFRSTNGYVPPPLEAVWTRAPYLHNGSVPTLRDLLEPREKRPTVFYRGYNVFDSKNVGLVSQGADAERLGFRYDTAERGNSNEGHPYGTELPAADKDALIEYLKTL